MRHVPDGQPGTSPLVEGVEWVRTGHRVESIGGAPATGPIRLIDRDGLGALSMRGLADELGAGAASRLYGHIRNKAELLVFVVDALAGEINEAYESRSSPTWREHAAAFARAVRLVVCEVHPRAATLFLPRMGLGPNVLGGMEELLDALRGAGLEGPISPVTGPGPFSAAAFGGAFGHSGLPKGSSSTSRKAR